MNKYGNAIYGEFNLKQKVKRRHNKRLKYNKGQRKIQVSTTNMSKSPFIQYNFVSLTLGG